MGNLNSRYVANSRKIDLSYCYLLITRISKSKQIFYGVEYSEFSHEGVFA